MKQKLLDLLAHKKAVVDRMREADQANDQEAFEQAQAALAPLDQEISRVEAIVRAEESLPAQPTPVAAGDGGRTDTPVNSDACIRAFCNCIRAQARGDRQMFVQNVDIVRRAVRDEGGMNETAPAEGGLLVPQDIQTKINEQRRALHPLSRLFSVSEVSSLTGFRVIDTHPTAGFVKLAEFGVISRDDKPAFAKVEYKVEDYALIVPVSNDLLEDTDQALLAYLSGWFAKKSVITENRLLLTLLSGLQDSAATAAAGKELPAIKQALNMTLDPAIALTSGFVTNQDGFHYLDTLEDKNGRPLLQPDPTDATHKMLLGRAVTVCASSMLASAGGKAPLYVGDFTQYGTLFRRKALELAATNVGGSAWDTNSTEVRGIMRMDARVFDAAAAAAVLLTLPA